MHKCNEKHIIHAMRRIYKAAVREKATANVQVPIVTLKDQKA